MLVNILNICSDDELGETEEEMTDESEGRQRLLDCGDVVFMSKSVKNHRWLGEKRTHCCFLVARQRSRPNVPGNKCQWSLSHKVKIIMDIFLLVYCRKSIKKFPFQSLSVLFPFHVLKTNLFFFPFSLPVISALLSSSTHSSFCPL